MVEYSFIFIFYLVVFRDRKWVIESATETPLCDIHIFEPIYKTHFRKN